MIPKVIYQTWETKQIPDKIKQKIEEMLKINPNYSYELFDDSDRFYFLKENYGNQVVSAYEKLNIGAAKADLWRYAMLYKNGGVYLDIDSEIISNLDFLISKNDIAIISREGNPNKFVQWCLMFDKNHPILEKTLKKCVFNILNKTTENIYKLTGPDLFSDCIREVLSPLNLDLYNTDDSIINQKMENINFLNIKTKFYSTDYKNYCNFKHEHSDELYKFKPHWKTEIERTNIFK
jgi:mannosyltransferase OCH1-like enzyme